ncbi:hypothetical protein NTE19_003337 [Vibrio fluvialis]|nr:hypothetical protein [Vibrio fluvialis]
MIDLLNALNHQTTPETKPYVRCAPLKKFYSFEEARKVVKKMGIRTRKEYNKARLEDERLPSQPDTVYPEWQGTKHFLGKG